MKNLYYLSPSFDALEIRVLNQDKPTEIFSFSYDSRMDKVAELGVAVLFRDKPYYVTARGFYNQEDGGKVRTLHLSTPEQFYLIAKKGPRPLRDLDKIISP